jgi:hypothetical protein
MVMQSNKQADPNGQMINHQSPVTADESQPTIVINNQPPATEAKSWLEKWSPVFTSIAGVLIASAVGYSGWSQSQSAANQQKYQFESTANQQKSDSEDKARETKEQVLTDYSKTIGELVTKSNLGKRDDSYVQNIARGQTLVALRRLNASDGNGKDDKSKVDAGKLKGLLIRYLYDAWLIGYDPSYYGLKKPPVKPTIDLFGANITNVVLEDAWLPGIGLQKAWLNEGNFKNAYLNKASLYQVSLIHADFSGADLREADLRGADLRFANLAEADISEAKLDSACYVKGKEAEYFPSDFKPEKFKMVAIPEDKSDPNKPNFERCPTVFLGAKPQL